MKRTAFVLPFLVILLCASSTHFRAGIRDLYLTDSVRVIGSVGQYGFLNVQLIYRNRDRDAFVFWKKGEVTCDYRVYELEGDPLNRIKGKRITGGRRILKSFSEVFPVKIKRRYLRRGKWGLVECDVRIYDKEIRGTGKFMFR